MFSCPAEPFPADFFRAYIIRYLGMPPAAGILPSGNAIRYKGKGFMLFNENFITFGPHFQEEEQTR